MILVNKATAASDYAIMKQIQQIRLILGNNAMPVVPLDPQPDLSTLAIDQKIYVVSHGTTSDFILEYVKKDALLGYFTHATHGLPQNFRGDIIILSCYGGDNSYKTSIAGYLANGLKGRAAANTVVTGAIGYSFGTPEFGHTGRSSVLRDSDFYSVGDINGMATKWLTLTPTHTGGVLKDSFNLNVDTGETICDQLATVQNKGAPEAIARGIMTDFADKVTNQIEEILRARLRSIPVNTLAGRADYLVNQNGEQIVIDWNAAIAQQYKLYGDLYLWVPRATAFTIERVPN